ncbi:MAG TPA: hypothetical protein VLX90_05725 [Steroidobacteraceae bacterium]|nr:hypothetical protein [Steroidobacteraceae bacterium]
MRTPLLALLLIHAIGTAHAQAVPAEPDGMPSPAQSDSPPPSPDQPAPGRTTGQSGQTDTGQAGTAAQPGAPAQGPPAQGPPAQGAQDVPYHWLDRTHQVLNDSMWRSAEHVDRWFGSVADDTVYEQLYGSIAPALLYTQYDGLRAQMRFNMNIPLPQINDRLHAFVGRFDPNEFITERDEPSGAFPRTYGPPTEDQTLLGIGYHEPAKSQQGGRFDAGAGIRLALPTDPYIKGSYVFERGASETGLFSIRETLFWQHSEGFGATTRLDLEHIYDVHWLVRYTASATRSQQSQGLRGYSSVLLLHELTNRRAVALEVGFDGSSEAPVPLHDYGVKAAFRKGILRQWLIMEIRGSIDWPKDFTYQHRSLSLGVGIGFEMLFGTSTFLARPVTF